MTNERLQEIITESLRDWFKKENWVRIDTAGNITGPCGTMKKGKAYIKRRKAAGEKSSAYLLGRAVKVCKGQMKG